MTSQHIPFLIPWAALAASAALSCGNAASDVDGTSAADDDSAAGDEAVEVPDLPAPPFAEPRAVAWRVGAGLQLSCVQPLEGNVRCWGRDFAADAVAVPAAPLAVVDLGDWIHCGLLESGRPRCFGSPWTSRSPDEELLDVSAGYGHFCGIRGSDGGLVCWTLDEQDSEPALDPPEGRFVDVDSGYGFSCALNSEGRASCWGRNDDRLAAPEAAFASLSLGPDYACGLTLAGEILCWGSLSTSGLSGPFSLVAAGGWGICALRPDGELACSGDAATVTPDAELGFRQVAVGPRHACGIATTGRVACWGDADNVDASALTVPSDLKTD